MSGLCLLRDYLTTENHIELLAGASHKTKFQILEMLASRFPRPDCRVDDQEVAGQTDLVGCCAGDMFCYVLRKSP